MNNGVKKNAKSKTIITIMLFFGITSLGLYYMYSKYNDKSKVEENGSAISGYMLYLSST